LRNTALKETYKTLKTSLKQGRDKG